MKGTGMGKKGLKGKENKGITTQKNRGIGTENNGKERKNGERFGIWL